MVMDQKKKKIIQNVAIQLFSECTNSGMSVPDPIEFVNNKQKYKTEWEHRIQFYGQFGEDDDLYKEHIIRSPYARYMKFMVQNFSSEQVKDIDPAKIAAVNPWLNYVYQNGL